MHSVLACTSKNLYAPNSYHSHKSYAHTYITMIQSQVMQTYSTVTDLLYILYQYCFYQPVQDHYWNLHRACCVQFMFLHVAWDPISQVVVWTVKWTLVPLYGLQSVVFCGGCIQYSSYWIHAHKRLCLQGTYSHGLPGTGASCRRRPAVVLPATSLLVELTAAGASVSG